MTKRLALLFAASAVAALFTQPASAQFSMPGIDLTPDGNSRRYTPEEKEKMHEIDQNYKATMKKVPDKKQPYDPWAGARRETPNTKQR
jgi:hypothetical protein